MMAAIAAASRGASVSLFEKNEYPGRKLLQTGNGKCNFSNTSVSSSRYRGSLVSSGIFDEVLNSLSPEMTLKLFSSFGLIYKEKNGGFYPASFSASTVNDVLIDELNLNMVSFHGLTQVKQIERKEGLFFLSLNHLKDNRKTVDETGFDAVIISTGGKAYPKTGSTGDGYFFANRFGLKVIDPLPALTRLISPDPFFNDNKIRCEASVTLFIDDIFSASSRGELQLSDSGPSGICVFDLSGRASAALKDGKKCSLFVDLLPDLSFDRAFELISKRASVSDRISSPSGIFLGLFSERLSLNVFEYLERRLFPEGFPSRLSEDQISSIVSEIKNMSFVITGTGDFNSSQVTSGGISAESLNPDLSVKGIPGLFFSGEVLDIDGDCGGFNLQWAFSSGYAAGINAAEGDI